MRKFGFMKINYHGMFSVVTVVSKLPPDFFTPSVEEIC